MASTLATAPKEDAQDATSCTTVMVIAKYDFDGRNNDELSFCKNDVIAVTQQIDGGDFVGVVNTAPSADKAKKSDAQSNGKPHENGSSTDFDSTKIAYRKEIISNYLAKEKEHVLHLERLLFDNLASIKNASLLKPEEFLTLCSNMKQVLELKKLLLTQSEEEARSQISVQRFGQVINANSDTLTKFLATKKLELNKDLIAGLSVVFRHVDKYTSTLQEIERNTPEAHPDRGNLQRACVVYRQLYSFCEYVRKQKESQMEFLSSGVLSESVGKDFEKMLGTFIYIGKVTVHRYSAAVVADEEDGPVIDRCIAVFSKSILLLESLLVENSYALRNRISTCDLTVSKDISKLSVHFRKGTKVVLVLRALTNEDHQHLTEALKDCVNILFQEEQPKPATSAAPDIHPEPAKHVSSPAKGADLADSWTSSSSPADSTRKKKQPGETSASNFLRLNHQLEMILPDGDDDDPATVSSPSLPSHSQFLQSPSRAASGHSTTRRTGSRGEYLPGSMVASAIKLRKGLSPEEQEDALMLKVVEGYCGPASSGFSHHHRNSSGSKLQQNKGSANMLNNHSSSTSIGGGAVRRAASYPEEVQLRPQLIVAEDEKIFVEEMEDGQLVMKERSLVDTVYALKDQLEAMHKDMANLSKPWKKSRKLEGDWKKVSVVPAKPITIQLLNHQVFRKSWENKTERKTLLG
uniref:DH domain-containing protein n=1 Tax=Ditylenchus dipsaci TaxID=166011 RepID=A0A915CVR4_9BILA